MRLGNYFLLADAMLLLKISNRSRDISGAESILSSRMPDDIRFKNMFLKRMSSGIRDDKIDAEQLSRLMVFPMQGPVSI